jgi:hypothetical protein
MKDIHRALFIGLSSRILVIAVFVLCSVLFTTSSLQPAVHITNPVPLANLFYRYDSGFYISIARTGYPLGKPDISYWASRNINFSFSNPVLAKPDWAFFPLYPALIKALQIPFMLLSSNNPAQLTNATVLSGFIISNIAFFVSVYFFYKLTNKLFSSTKIALAATAFYSFWIGAAFYSAIYSEATFMALALGAFYYLEEDKLPTAVLLGFLASFTRSDGLLISIPFLIYALQSIKNKPKSLKLLISSVVVASPFLIFQLIGYEVAGGVFPITVISHNLNWGVYPLLTTQLAQMFSGSLKIFAFYGIGLVLIFLPTAYFISRLRIGSIKNNLIQESKLLKYWAFYASIIVVIIYQSIITSIIRYAIPMLPIYWVSAIIYTKNRWAGIMIFAVITGMLIVGSYMLETGGPFM